MDSKHGVCETTLSARVANTFTDIRSIIGAYTVSDVLKKNLSQSVDFHSFFAGANQKFSVFA